MAQEVSANHFGLSVAPCQLSVHIPEARSRYAAASVIGEYKISPTCHRPQRGESSCTVSGFNKIKSFLQLLNLLLLAILTLLTTNQTPVPRSALPHWEPLWRTIQLLSKMKPQHVTFASDSTTRMHHYPKISGL
ncbi:hypothetical protein N7454_010461 [Penicillium verhagenii]|nr:hypothetical protein N7454_010461 [Penicillium verhagenii]